jgi:hypothetical protein
MKKYKSSPKLLKSNSKKKVTTKNKKLLERAIFDILFEDEEQKNEQIPKKDENWLYTSGKTSFNNVVTTVKNAAKETVNTGASMIGAGASMIGAGAKRALNYFFGFSEENLENLIEKKNKLEDKKVKIKNINELKKNQENAIKDSVKGLEKTIKLEKKLKTDLQKATSEEEKKEIEEKISQAQFDVKNLNEQISEEEKVVQNIELEIKAQNEAKKEVEQEIKKLAKENFLLYSLTDEEATNKYNVIFQKEKDFVRDRDQIRNFENFKLTNLYDFIQQNYNVTRYDGVAQTRSKTKAKEAVEPNEPNETNKSKALDRLNNFKNDFPFLFHVKGNTQRLHNTLNDKFYEELKSKNIIDEIKNKEKFREYYLKFSKYIKENKMFNDKDRDDNDGNHIKSHSKVRSKSKTINVKRKMKMSPKRIVRVFFLSPR